MANLNSSELVISQAICKSETPNFAYSRGDEVSGRFSRGLRQMLCNANRIIMTKSEIILGCLLAPGRRFKWLLMLFYSGRMQNYTNTRKLIKTITAVQGTKKNENIKALWYLMFLEVSSDTNQTALIDTWF